MRKSFIINGILVTIQGEGKVKVFTNDISKKEFAIDLKEYFEGACGNKTCLLFDSEEIIKDYLGVISKLSDIKFRKMNGIGAGYSFFLDILNRCGCITTFTTNGCFEGDYDGREFADQWEYDIVKVESIKLA